MKLETAISHIESEGLLLVFPINNRPEPHSLWSAFFPRTKMRWEWDDAGDARVSRTWQLMKRLSHGGRVVYSKWYQGRATFFSRALFTATLRVLQEAGDPRRGLSRPARDLLEALESDSPLSTKVLKRATDLQGRANESTYSRAMKELFQRQLIVAYGEVDDGAFPSLAVGATQLLYEDLWNEASEMPLREARGIVGRAMPPGSPFRKFFDRILKDLEADSGAAFGADPEP